MALSASLRARASSNGGARRTDRRHHGFTGHDFGASFEFDALQLAADGRRNRVNIPDAALAFLFHQNLDGLLADARRFDGDRLRPQGPGQGSKSRNGKEKRSETADHGRHSPEFFRTAIMSRLSMRRRTRRPENKAAAKTTRLA